MRDFYPRSVTLLIIVAIVAQGVSSQDLKV